MPGFGNAAILTDMMASFEDVKIKKKGKNVLKNYVISMNTATLRRKHITQEFEKRKIPFEFFDAITPSCELEEAIQCFIPNLAQYKYLTSGEKACFMSHVLLLQKCIDDDLPYIGIFEDDVLLGDDAQLFLQQDLWLQERFQHNESFIIKLETHLTPTNIKPDSNIKPHANRVLNILCTSHGGAAGYIISRTAANFFLQQLAVIISEKIRPIDILLFETFLNCFSMQVYQLTPALCIQEDRHNMGNSKIKSQLQEERTKNWQNNPEPRKKRKFKERIIRIFGKINRILEKRNRQVIPFQ